MPIMTIGGAVSGLFQFFQDNILYLFINQKLFLIAFNGPVALYGA